MGNNIKQKNLVFSFRKSGELPYKSVNSVKYSGNNKAIDNSIYVNNTLEQFVENDSVIEYQLEYNKTRKTGPKENLSDDIYYGPDGYKYWSDEDGSCDIFHKKDIPIQDSFVKFENFTNVRFTFQIDPYKIVIATTDRTYLIDVDFRKFNPTELKYDGQPVKILAHSRESDPYFMSIDYTRNTIEGPRRKYSVARIVSDYAVDADGIAIKDENNEYVMVYSFKPVIDFEEPVKVLEFNRPEYRIACATEHNLHIMRLDLKLDNAFPVYDLKFVNDQQINAIACTDMTKSGLTKFNEMIMADNARNLYLTDRGAILSELENFEFDQRINAMADLGSDIYFATPDGLYCAASGDLENIEKLGTESRDYIDMFKFSDEFALLIERAGESTVNVYQLAATGRTVQFVETLDETKLGKFIRIGGDNKYIFIVTDNGIYVKVSGIDFTKIYPEENNEEETEAPAEFEFSIIDCSIKKEISDASKVYFHLCLLTKTVYDDPDLGIEYALQSQLYCNSHEMEYNIANITGALPVNQVFPNLEIPVSDIIKTDELIFFTYGKSSDGSSTVCRIRNLSDESDDTVFTTTLVLGDYHGHLVSEDFIYFCFENICLRFNRDTSGITICSLDPDDKKNWLGPICGSKQITSNSIRPSMDEDMDILELGDMFLVKTYKDGKSYCSLVYFSNQPFSCMSMETFQIADGQIEYADFIELDQNKFLTQVRDKITQSEVGYLNKAQTKNSAQSFSEVYWHDARFSPGSEFLPSKHIVGFIQVPVSETSNSVYRSASIKSLDSSEETNQSDNISYEVEYSDSTLQNSACLQLNKSLNETFFAFHIKDGVWHVLIPWIQKLIPDFFGAVTSAITAADYESSSEIQASREILIENPGSLSIADYFKSRMDMPWGLIGNVFASKAYFQDVSIQLSSNLYNCENLGHYINTAEYDGETPQTVKNSQGIDETRYPYGPYADLFGIGAIYTANSSNSTSIRIYWLKSVSLQSYYLSPVTINDGVFSPAVAGIYNSEANHYEALDIELFRNNGMENQVSKSFKRNACIVEIGSPESGRYPSITFKSIRAVVDENTLRMSQDKQVVMFQYRSGYFDGSKTIYDNDEQTYVLNEKGSRFNVVNFKAIDKTPDGRFVVFANNRQYFIDDESTVEEAGIFSFTPEKVIQMPESEDDSMHDYDLIAYSDGIMVPGSNRLYLDSADHHPVMVWSQLSYINRDTYVVDGGKIFKGISGALMDSANNVGYSVEIADSDRKTLKFYDILATEYDSDATVKLKFDRDFPENTKIFPITVEDSKCEFMCVLDDGLFYYNSDGDDDYQNQTPGDNQPYLLRFESLNKIELDNIAQILPYSDDDSGRALPLIYRNETSDQAATWYTLTYDAKLMIEDPGFEIFSHVLEDIRDDEVPTRVHLEKIHDKTAYVQLSSTSGIDVMQTNYSVSKTTQGRIKLQCRQVIMPDDLYSNNTAIGFLYMKEDRFNTDGWLYAYYFGMNYKIGYPYAGSFRNIAMFQNGDKFYLRYMLNGKQTNLTFKDVALNQLYLIPLNADFDGSPDERLLNVVRTADNDYIIESNEKIYNYFLERQNGVFVDWSYPVYESSLSALAQLDKFKQDGVDFYIATDGKTMLSSENSRAWLPMYYVESEQAAENELCSVSYVSRHDILVSKHGQLWKTEYKYDLENDTKDFTEEDAFHLYESQAENLETAMDSKIQSEHIVQQHNGASNIDIMNRYTTTKFEIVGDLTQTEKYSGSEEIKSVANDYIVNIFTDADVSSDVVNACVKSNVLGNNRTTAAWKRVPVGFIAKMWNSGMVDLYIYLKTTYTYYIPHLAHAGNCVAGDTEIKVNGKTVKTNVKDNYTSIRLTVLSSFFAMECLMENQIKANSLPLKIFTDTQSDYVDAEGDGAKLYHSFILPSVAKDSDLTDVKYDRYNLDYQCFGSDAQALKLTYFDSHKNYLKNYKRIVYHGSTGRSIFDGSDIVTQRVFENSEANLYDGGCFQNGDSIFLGWSESKKAKPENLVAYSKLEYDEIPGKAKHLYAVWNNYKFGDADTKLNVSTQSGQTYTIAELDVDVNANPGGSNEPLGNIVLIDWDN